MSYNIYNNKQQSCIVALDGPSASGKGLIGSMIAEEFGLLYYQSSIVYRVIAYLVQQRNIQLDNINAIVELTCDYDIISSQLSQLSDVDLNLESIGEIASQISVIPSLRAHLTLYLQKIIQSTSRIVMEGRDVGTVIAPNAHFKIFITADINIRANRRCKQLQSSGKQCTIDDILNLMRVRDQRDVSRDIAPLQQAPDSLYIDASHLTPLDVMCKIRKFIK